MKHLEAVALIKDGVINETRSQLWMDLGCGGGTFTLALASIIPRESRIYAIDKGLNVMSAIPEIFGSVLIQKTGLNFIVDELPNAQFDGILMANSLHYVPEKSLFLKKTINRLKPGGNLIIVEYNVLNSNPMVPYPINSNELEESLAYHGMIRSRILGEKKSRYGHMIYSLGSTKQ